MSDFTKEELKKIKDNCVFWSNNCGGCETCSQLFGNKEPLYDFEETFRLVCMIEELQSKVKVLETMIECSEEDRPFEL